MHSDQGSLTATDVYRRLRAAGYRLTAPRRALVDALLAADAPLGAEELHARVNGSGLNLSTVYRNLSKFVLLGWVETVPGLNGERRFSVNTGRVTDSVRVTLSAHCGSAGRGDRGCARLSVSCPTSVPALPGS